MALYCGEIANEERRSEYMKFIVKMGDRRFRDRLMKDAASVLPIASAEFDANPYLINCKNGTFDLEKMEFREHDWKDFPDHADQLQLPLGSYLFGLFHLLTTQPV